MKKSILLLALSFFLIGDCTRVKKQIIPLFEGIAPQEDGGLKVANTSSNSGKIESISVTPPTATIAKDTKTTFKATAIYSDGSKVDITDLATWSTDTENTASAAPKGIATGKSAGSANIIANYDNLSGKGGLKVTDATVVAIQVSRPENIDVGTTTNVKAVAILSDGTTQDVTNFVDWSSTSPAVTVSNDEASKGKTTGKATGDAPITATLNGVSGSSNVTVVQRTLVGISVDASTTIVKGSQKTYIATAIYSDETTQDVTNSVTWSSSNTEIAGFNSADASIKSLVTGLTTGAAVITATLNGVSGTSNLTVISPKLVSITVEAVGGNSIAKGTNKQFKAIATFEDGSTLDVTDIAAWTSSDANTVGMANASGKSGLSYGLNQGSAVVTATLSGKSGSANLTVTEAALVSISISGSSSIQKGTTGQFTATGVYTDGSSQNITSLVTWNSSNTVTSSISNIVGTNGKAYGDSAGTTNVTATLSGVTSSALPLTVNGATLTSINVTPANSSVSKSNTAQSFIATGTYSDGTTQNITSLVTWASSNTSIATISNAADATKGQASTVGVGSTTVSASLSGVTGSTNFTVTPATLVSIVVTPASGSIAAGTTQQFVATGVYSDGTTANITNLVSWSSGNTGTATIGSSSGLATGVAAGTTNITASLNGITGSTPLTATSATLTSISINEGDKTIAKGTSQQFTAVAHFSDGSTQPITTSATWTSGTTNVANITANGGLASSFLTGQGATGTSTITATYNGKTATVTLTVSNATLSSIQVNPVNPTVAKGLTQAFTATGIYSDNSNQDITNSVTWSSGTTGVATISNAAGSKGLATTTTTAAIGGTSIITATDPATNISGNTTLTVGDAAITGITVSSPNNSVAKGLTEQFQATATYSDGTTGTLGNLTSNVSWTTNNANMSMDGTTKGLGKGDNAGTVTVKASLVVNGVTIEGTKSFTIDPKIVTGITVTSTNNSRAKGLTEQFQATATYSDGSTGTTGDLTNSVSWSSNNAALSMNASTGLGTANSVASGITVTASKVVNGATITGTKTFEVTDAQLLSIAVTGASSVSKNLTTQMVATGTYTDGAKTITSDVTWKSDSNADGTDDALIASINNTTSKGLVTGTNVGTSKITASLGGVTSPEVTMTVTAATSSTSTVGNYNVTIPTGINTTTTPTGAFTGTTYNTANNAAGFISVIPDYTTSPNTCQAQGTAILGKILADTPDLVTASDQVSSNTTNFTGGCTITYYLTITTSASKTATQLSDHLITNVGVNAVGGTVSNLPTSQASEVATTSFRGIVQVTYSTGSNNQVIGIGITNSTDYATNQALLESFLGGTNITPQGTTYLSKTDSFTGAADPKVDFVWVVDSSNSMSQEQTAITNAANTFFTKLSAKHLDYRLGVISTGGIAGSNKCTNPDTKGESLRSAGWVTSSTVDAQATFTGTSGTTVGIDGCGTESGIYFASRSLGGNGATATVTPRAGQTDWGSSYKLVYIMVSDESDQYRCYPSNSSAYPFTVNTTNDNDVPPCNSSNVAFDYNSSKFKEKGVKVYSIIGLNATTGQPGTCSGNGVSASNTNNAWTGYYDLSAASGGSSASICSADYNAIMDSIVNSVAGSSGYVLSKTPQSSSIVVKVGGVTVAQDSTNGWQYVSASKSIVFSGTAWPATGASITVTYQYTSDQGAFNTPKSKNEKSSLLAFISKAGNNNTAKAGILIFLVVSGVLLGRLWMGNKKK